MAPPAKWPATLTDAFAVEERIRIISARKAEPYERRKYHDENQEA